jgi:hypothetical protein
VILIYSVQYIQFKAHMHPGVLAAKVGYFGVKSAKVCRAQMGTKPAKVGRLGPRCAKVRRGLHPAPTGASAKRSSIHAASKVAKVGAAGGPKLLKWGRLRSRQGAGSNLLKSDRRRRLTKRSSLHKKRSSLRGRTKVAKVGPLRTRVKWFGARLGGADCDVFRVSSP